jgi:hypothetical protein
MNYSVERIHSSAAAAQKCRAHWSGNEKLSFSMNPSGGGLSYGKFLAIDEKFEVGWIYEVDEQVSMVVDVTCSWNWFKKYWK